MIAFLFSPLGRRLMVVLAIAGLLWGAYAYAYGKGKSAGVIEGQAAQLEMDRKQFEQDRQQFLDTLKKYQEQDDAAKQAIAQKDSELAAIKARRSDDRKAIAALPDSGIVADLNARLGIKPEEPLSPGTLRLVDEAVAASASLKLEVEALEAKSQAQDQRIAALEGQKQAAVDAYQKLVPLYVKAWNAAQRKRPMWQKIVSFGILRDKKLNLPAPSEIEK